jgi:hypothetical protein
VLSTFTFDRRDVINTLAAPEALGVTLTVVNPDRPSDAEATTVKSYTISLVIELAGT